jgi:hypothetical protein
VRWEPAIGHRGDAAERFLAARCSNPAKRILLIAGAGFDPRARIVPLLLQKIAGGDVRLVLLREHRPDPQPELASLAQENIAAISMQYSTPAIVDLQIFGIDSAVIGGREAARIATEIKLDDVGDVIVDFSALSIGTSFPLTAVLLQRADELGINVHATVVASSALDQAITPLPTESAIPVHGFRGDWGLDRTANAARLWLPQLAFGQNTILDRIFREVQPHDICPLLPFPAQHPRRGDDLIEAYIDEIQSTWEVNQRSIIYADENDAVDVYRTILALDDDRRPVFDGDGGSVCVLSPVGSKVLALGCLMAAAERNFPVLYVEAVGYKVDSERLAGYTPPGELVHVWLAGEPYTRNGNG